MASTGEASTVRHPIFARLYARLSPAMDRGGLAEHRAALVADAAGRVMEVGAGAGANFAHYPSQVTEVTAVEPEPYLRRVARAAAGAAPVPVTVVDGRAEHLPAGDRTFDAVVACLMLCSVDADAALAEMFRVLKPGGRLLFLEHVVADTPGLRRVQRVLDATVWPAVSGGCHLARDTRSAIARAGFVVDRIERLVWPESRPPSPSSPHIRGIASRPAAA